MTTLLLRLAAPLQSWGTSSRFNRRDTHPHPTKSGVLGLLAAADGRRRTDSIVDLLALRLAIRVDQPGQILRDYHTVSRSTGDRRLPVAAGGKREAGLGLVTERRYLADALFLAAVEGEDGLIGRLDTAVRQPRFPLALGRRCCLPVPPVTLGLRAASALDALSAEPWQARPHEQRRLRQNPTVQIEIVYDDPLGDESLPDLPLSFDPAHRSWGSRRVGRTTVALTNPATPPPRDIDHDPFALLG